jgi:hypothetical protein
MVVAILVVSAVVTHQITFAANTASNEKEDSFCMPRKQIDFL